MLIGLTAAQVIGAPTLFATHFHELTGLTGAGGVSNMHVQTAIDQASGKLTMLYQVIQHTNSCHRLLYNMSLIQRQTIRVLDPLINTLYPIHTIRHLDVV